MLEEKDPRRKTQDKKVFHLTSLISLTYNYKKRQLAGINIPDEYLIPYYTRRQSWYGRRWC
jgi:hypothetical protein